MRYLRQWLEQGFTPEAVALAYDKTVFHKKELNWRYLNGILRRWHEAGWHTVEEVQQGEQRTVRRTAAAVSREDEAHNRREGDEWMRRYIKK